MTKVVDIERLENKYLHRISTQFDNAIFVAENEFLIDAYTKADIVSMLDKIRAEVEAIERYDTNNGKDLWLRTPEEIKEDVLTIIDKYKAESEKSATVAIIEANK